MAEVAMQYTDSYSEVILSLPTTSTPLRSGMHEEGFKQALTNALNTYGRKAKILKEDERSPATTAGRALPASSQ